MPAQNFINDFTNIQLFFEFDATSKMLRQKMLVAYQKEMVKWP